MTYLMLGLFLAFLVWLGVRNTAQKPQKPREAHLPSPVRRPEMSEKITSMSDLRLFFHRNERPIYFISATNFNLAGMDERVPHFKHINYIDCFDGRHPNVFVPSEQPHPEFEGIEDINNYLLQHKIGRAHV